MGFIESTNVSPADAKFCRQASASLTHLPCINVVPVVVTPTVEGRVCSSCISQALKHALAESEIRSHRHGVLGFSAKSAEIADKANF